MSETISKRLFIGGLSSSVSQDEIADRFSRFGNVSNLTIKSRQDEEGNYIKVFAHLNIEGSEDNIKKCFSTYQGTKWKGSVLKLQYAKENFLDRLEKEREEEVHQLKEISKVKEKKSSPEWKAPEFTKLSGPAVPGTPIPGKTDWVVGKYGRVLPILNVKKSYKIKAIKHDPSKYCHAAREFKDDATKDMSTAATCDDLTWEINKPDNEITKKRKGIFPPLPPNKKLKKPLILTTDINATSDTEDYEVVKMRQMDKWPKKPKRPDDFEVVRIGQGQSSTAKNSTPSKFDSDYEDDEMEDDKKIKQGQNLTVRNSTPSRFDSDYEEDDMEDDKKIKQGQNSTVKKSTPSRFDSDYEEDDMEDDNKIKQGQNSTVKNSTSSRFNSDYNKDDMDDGKDTPALKKNQQQNCKSKLQNSNVKTKELRDAVNLDDTSKKLFNVSPNVITNIPEGLKHNEVTPKNTNTSVSSSVTTSLSKKDTSPQQTSVMESATVTPKSSSFSDRRKVPEFAGLGMLMGAMSDQISKSEGNKNASESLSLNDARGKKKELEVIANNNDVVGKSTVKGDASGQKSKAHIVLPVGDINGNVGNSSIDKVQLKQSPEQKLSKGKKLTKKTKTHDSESPMKMNSSNAMMGIVDFVNSTKSSPKVDDEDDDDSVASDGTDEIIARCKNKVENSDFYIKDKKYDSLGKKDLNQSRDLSEFSASAPEILCNSIGNSSYRNSSGDSDSYDSDLDSNNFELVAKKLALKMNRSQPTSPAANIVEKNQKAIEIVSESHKKPEKKQETTIEKGEKLKCTGVEISNSGVKSKDLAASKDKPALQGQLLGITSSKPTEDKKTSSEKLSTKQKNKHVADNEKRLHALAEQKKVKEQQIQIVKTALKSVDNVNAHTRRIVFSSSDEDDDVKKKPTISQLEKSSPKKLKSKGDLKKSPKSSSKLKLMDSSASEGDESDYEDMFKSKPQFEGKKGQKLMALQSKIGDSRFQLDEKFMESDDSGDEDNEAKKKDAEPNSLADEKKMNLEVLENVVGKSKMDQFTAKLKKKTKHLIDMKAVRFDPTKMKMAQRTEELSGDEEEEEEEEMDTDVPEPSSPPPPKAIEDAKEKEASSKSAVTMSSSLVDMLKSQGATEDQTASTGNASFSLLQQFDQDEDGSESSEDEDTHEKAPLGSLSTSKVTMANSKKTYLVEKSDDDSDEDDDESSEEEIEVDSEEDANVEEEVSDEKEVKKVDEGSDEEEGSDDEEVSNNEEVSDKEEVSDEEEVMDEEEAIVDAKIQSDKAAHFSNKDQDHVNFGPAEEADEHAEEEDHIESITMQYDPQQEKERTILSAGRTDIRFTKTGWLEKWDEIRTDLMKICRRKHKDAGKRKRITNEKKRKKDILRSVKRKPWLKR